MLFCSYIETEVRRTPHACQPPPTTERALDFCLPPTDPPAFFCFHTSINCALPIANEWKKASPLFISNSKNESTIQQNTYTMRWTAVLLLVTARTAFADERTLLRELFDNTGGPSWSDNYGWSENLSNLCEWTGVTCASEMSPEAVVGIPADSVVGIELPRNFLSGRIPSTFWTLPYLIFVDVSFNAGLEVNLEGVANAKLEWLSFDETATRSVVGISGLASTLTSLHMSGIPLEGEFPTEVLQLTALEYLFMGSSGISGNIPSEIAQLSQLVELDLSENALTGPIPNAVTQLLNLELLSLRSNRLSENLSYLNFDDLTQLKFLYLNGNQLTGSIPSFSSQQNIEEIRLNKNAFSGAIPESFMISAVSNGNMTVVVDLSDNMLDTIPESLDNLEHLFLDLRLADNHFTFLPTNLCDNVNWPGVAEFHCSGIICPAQTYAPQGRATAANECMPCQTGDYLGAVVCLVQDEYSVLEQLFLNTDGEASWKIKWTLTDRNYCAWKGVHCDAQGHVTRIYVPNNGLKGAVPETIFHLPNLIDLDLSRNDITVPFDRIADAQSLASLNIAYTLTGDFAPLTTLNKEGPLQRFYADGIPISGTLPSEICAIRTLKTLSLSDCKLIGEIPTEIGNLGRLEELYLQGNELRGTLPSQIGQLQNLKAFSVAKNQMTGTLPSQLLRMPNLEALSLASQKGKGFSGAIPSFEASSKLTSVFLNDNAFTGQVPETLLRMADLDASLTVQLSNNNINGTVPGALAKFSALNLYVEGNSITKIDLRLCGLENWMSGSVGKYGCAAILCPAATQGGRQVFDDEPCEPCTDEAGSLLGQKSCGDGSQSPAFSGSEQDILELLYKQTGGVGWHNQDLWLSEESVCQWHGVGCNANGQVSSLTLGANQLIGNFPTEIYQLPALQRLVIFSNKINFSFEGIKNAANLKVLVLDSTGLTSLRGVGNAPALEVSAVCYSFLTLSDVVLTYFLSGSQRTIQQIDGRNAPRSFSTRISEVLRHFR